MAVSSEKIALLTTLAEEFNNSDAEVDGSCIFVRPRSVSSGRAAELIPEGWPSPDVNGEPPVIWSPAASGWAGIVNERAGTTLGASRDAVHAHSARHRHARTDGRGARVARGVDRLRRPPAPRHRSRGLGRRRRTGVGAVPDRQDEPELLDERTQLHDRRVLRSDRQVRRPDDRGSVPTGGRRVRHRHRVVGRPLRRHHDDVPQQLVRRRRTRARR